MDEIPLKHISQTTQKHPFKDEWFGKDKNMLRSRIFIVKNLDNRQEDDTITIYAVKDSSDLFRVVYHSSDYSRKQNQFYLSKNSILNYIEDLLRSLKYDSEPFEYVQISTEMHPSVLYHAMDLEKLCVRNLIVDMINTTLKHNIEAIPLPRRIVIV